MNLPLLCSHPSLTITTLVMLVGRVEDPGFPQGETRLRFPTLLDAALHRSLETGSSGSQPPSQRWLPISPRRVKISLVLRWESFSTRLNINPRVNTAERRRGGGIEKILVIYGLVSGVYAQTTAQSLSHVEPAPRQGSNICVRPWFLAFTMKSPCIGKFHAVRTQQPFLIDRLLFCFFFFRS